MKLYKLKVSGSDDDFSVQYAASKDFVTYYELEFSGSEQEKFTQFRDELGKDKAANPINVKVNMRNRKIDRALPRALLLSIDNVVNFIHALDQ